jgi:hypothetical protein
MQDRWWKLHDRATFHQDGENCEPAQTKCKRVTEDMKKTCDEFKEILIDSETAVRAAYDDIALLIVHFHQH